MKMTLTAYDAKKIMIEMERDYFSVDGLEKLIDYYDSIDENTEFDPVGICCYWTEYGDYDCAMGFDDLVNDFDYLLDDDEKCTTDNIISKLEERTCVLDVANGNYLISAF